MPHSSASGTPIAWKNSITSRGVGAAPTLHGLDLGRGRGVARIFESTSSSAFACSCSSSSGTSSPGLLGLHLAQARRSSAHCGRLLALLVLLGGHRRPRAPAFSFSQMRGTAKNQVGRTSGR